MAAVPAPSVMQLLRRRRRRRWLIVLLICGVLAPVIWMDWQGWFLYRGDDLAKYHEKTYTVNRVIDGDTLELDVPDGKKVVTVVRLWGIKAPEIAHPSFGLRQAEHLGPEAAMLAQQLAEGKQVRLELQSHRSRDNYGRLLAYVIFPDGKSLNEQLLSSGLATADNRPGDQRYIHQHMDRYARLQQQAQRERIGLWAGSASNKSTVKTPRNRATPAATQPVNTP